MSYSKPGCLELTLDNIFWLATNRFIVVCWVTLPLRVSNTFSTLFWYRPLLVMCKLCLLMQNSCHFHEKIREVCIKARSSAPSLAVIGQVNKHTSVKWPIPGIVCFTPERFKHYNQVLPNCRLQTAEPAEPIFFVKKIKWKEKKKEKPKNLIQFSKISFSGLKKITLKTKFVFIVVDLEVPWDFKIVATYVRCHSIPQHSINMAEWKRKYTR